MRLFVVLSVMLLFFSACTQRFTADGKHYITESCEKEMAYAKDYTGDDRVDKIVVMKSERKMYLYRDDKLVDMLQVSLGKNPVGHKVAKGDNRTPEGNYQIARKICSASYFRSLSISYPCESDICKAKEKGLDPGGDITIHAQPTWNADGNGNNYTKSRDWTRGCIAVSNKEMEKLWYEVRVGVPVIINK